MPADADELAGRAACASCCCTSWRTCVAATASRTCWRRRRAPSTGSTRWPGWPRGGRAPSASAPATIWCWRPGRAGRTTRRNCCRSPASCGPGASRRCWPARRWRWRTARSSKGGCSRSSIRQIPRGGLTRVRALATSIACSLAIMPLAALQPWTQCSRLTARRRHAPTPRCPIRRRCSRRTCRRRMPRERARSRAGSAGRASRRRPHRPTIRPAIQEAVRRDESTSGTAERER